MVVDHNYTYVLNYDQLIIVNNNWFNLDYQSWLIIAG